MKRLRLSGIRPRVVAAFAVAMAIVLAIIGVAIYQGVADQLTDATDSALEARAAAIARLIDERGAVGPGIARGLDDPGETFSQVIGPGERLLANSPGLPGAPLLGPAARAGAAEGVTIRLREVPLADDEGDEEIDTEALEDTAAEPFEDDRARVIARGVTVAGQRLAIVVGTTLEDREDALRALRWTLLIALPVALLVTGAAGWVAVGAALRPVERMRRRAAGISEASVAERLPLPNADDELRRLGTTLNAMLDRLEAALARERAFVADASHELRTPLAILRTELELALREQRTPEELLEAIRSGHEEAAALSALADNLLTLAQADEGALALRRAAVDLQALCDRVARRFAGVFAPAGRTLSVAPGEPLVVTADAMRLEQALGNLVENALRHGAGPVELGVRRALDGGAVELWVGDRGPGVSADLAGRAFDRFARGDAARSGGGTGLGLAIGAAIARAHGGSARLEPRAGGGTEAVVCLPA